MLTLALPQHVLSATATTIVVRIVCHIRHCQCHRHLHRLSDNLLSAQTRTRAIWGGKSMSDGSVRQDEDVKVDVVEHDDSCMFGHEREREHYIKLNECGSGTGRILP